MASKRSGGEGSPVDRILAFTLRQGTVYYLAHRDLTSAEPHYFVVLNQNPRQDRVLLMVVASSQVDKVKERARRQNLPEATVVEISTQEYPEFSKPSCINCNQLFQKSLLELSNARKHRELRSQQDMPLPLMERIIAGCLASPLLSAEEKAMIRQPSDP